MLRPRKDVLELAARSQYDGYGQLLNTQRLARLNLKVAQHGGRLRTGWPGHPDYTGASMPNSGSPRGRCRMTRPTPVRCVWSPLLACRR